MAATGLSGPLVAYGSMADLPTSLSGAPSSGTQFAGPSVFYHGVGLPDPRFLLSKDRMGGAKGIIPAQFGASLYMSIDGTPALHAINNIAAAANVVSGTAMTLAAPSFGAVANIPIIPITATNNGLGGTAVVTPKLALDFGFALATTVSGSPNVTVADTTQFVVGMPIIVAAIATTTTPWLTMVQSITSATVLVTPDNAPFTAATGGARIGTGNIWLPSETGGSVPTAAFPYLASGAGAFLDPRQAISRGIVITCNNASGTGGAITVAGYDVYGQAMTETITSVPGSALTTYGVKAFKYITSVTPAFTDATYTYAVGTSDVFGFALRSAEWENTVASWNAIGMTVTQGWTAALAAATASTATTADVRGTIQTSAIGGGTGIGSTASNGSHSGTAFTGIKLVMGNRPALQDVIFATPNNSAALFGNTQG